MTEGANSAGDTFRTQGEAVLFGFPSTPLQVALRARSKGWRMGGAARALAIALVVAPAVTVIPPHAPWLIGALAIGGIMARRRWMEHFTVVEVTGTCPKCRAQLHVKPGRLRSPHPLPCDACHHESTLRLPERTLEAHRA